MPLRIWHKVLRLVNFPRDVLMELAAIRQAQVRLEGRLDNFVRMLLQNQDASGDLIISIKRKIEDHAGQVEAALQEFKETYVNHSIKRDPEHLLANVQGQGLGVEDGKPDTD